MSKQISVLLLLSLVCFLKLVLANPVPVNVTCLEKFSNITTECGGKKVSPKVNEVSCCATRDVLKCAIKKVNQDATCRASLTSSGGVIETLEAKFKEGCKDFPKCTKFLY